MLFANVVFGLPIDGPFDYAIPPFLKDKAKRGMRVWVNFHNKKMLGYIVGISKTSKVDKVKPVQDIVDDKPILTDSLLKLTKNLADYYACSWGEAIEAAIPE
ncbi:MAG: primosomal protein N', partial [Candidatus Omnitrophica bacterium]|nr:primosomal protein N' [Candidatus Omnitrophota bacterium]